MPRFSPRASNRSGSRVSEPPERRLGRHRGHRGQPRRQLAARAAGARGGGDRASAPRAAAGASARSRPGRVNSSKISRRCARSSGGRSKFRSICGARVLDQLVVLHPRRAGGHAGHAAEAAVEVLDHRRRDLLVALLHQHDPPARRVHLLAPQHVGRARGQAEAAVHAVVDQVELGRPGGVVAAHTHTPAGSKRSFTRRISSRAPGSTRPGPVHVQIGRAVLHDGHREVAPQPLHGVRARLLEAQPRQAERRAAHHRAAGLVRGAREVREVRVGSAGHLHHQRAALGRRAARPTAARRRRRSPSRGPRRAAASRPPPPAAAAPRRAKRASTRPRPPLPARCRARAARAATAPMASAPRAELVRAVRLARRPSPCPAATGCSRTDTSRIAPSVPNEPANSFARS